MGKLPVLSGKEVIAKLKQTGQKTLVTVPLHGNKEVLPKTLLSILRQAGLTREEFENL